MNRIKHLVLLICLLFIPMTIPATCFANPAAALLTTSSAGASDQQDSKTIVVKENQKPKTDTVTPPVAPAEIPENVNKKKPTSIIHKAAGFIHLLDLKVSDQDKDNSQIFLSFNQIPDKILKVLYKIGNGTLSGFSRIVLIIAAALGIAVAAELLLRFLTSHMIRQFQEQAIPQLDGPMRFVAGIIRSVPDMIYVMTFMLTAFTAFLLLPGSDTNASRQLFLAIILILLVYRGMSITSHIVCSPVSSALRLLPVTDQTADFMHKTVMSLSTYLAITVTLLSLAHEQGLTGKTFSFLVIIAASGLILLIMATVLRIRSTVKNHIINQSEALGTRNWVIDQFAQFWHIPTLAYFIAILMFLVGNELAGIIRENSAFLLSILVLPLFVIFDAIGQWIVRVSVKTLHITPDEEEEKYQENAPEDKSEALNHKEQKIIISTGRLVRLAIVATLGVWVFSLWGYQLPYATRITGAIFESFVTLTFGLIAWRFISSYIEKKILESTPEEEEEEESDNEFGNAQQRGRGFTILPMLRKFVATTLFIMISLVILSAIGVDIGPLLAGAGVVGLAVGFGAQKLVSDVFSGFFYLLDDAFRVGEYIQAGSVSGSVESITLRNVMLRHHRGMLQIVPYSELGAITNFMRGGLVVKFNLEFPYDTDIDKVRKIIKRVGIAMLDDDEFGKDFIRPVKSQGVREISNSVMVIRAKFTAQPGTQFVIQREAYRRITEALNAKGIFYAHRKVIVEIPEHLAENATEEQKKILESGAAAELARAEEEKKNKEPEVDKGPVMPG